MTPEDARRLVVLVVAVASCSSDPVPAAAIEASCADTRRVGAGCVGVPPQTSCFDASWINGIPCGSTVEVSDASGLAGALAAAEPGTCVAVAAGHYPRVEVPAGVALLGRGAGCVGVAGVTIAAGEGSVFRGVTVGSGGVVVTGTGAARIMATRVEGSAADGVAALGGATLTITDSEIVGSASYGLRLWGQGGGTVRRSLVEGSNGPGVWVDCAGYLAPGSCACVATPEVVLDTVVVRRNSTVGLALGGVSATLDSVDVVEQRESDLFEPGVGAWIRGCSRVTAAGLRVRDNVGPGLLVDDSDATFSGGLEVRGNRIGIALQTATERRIDIDGAEISENGGIGLFVASKAARVMLTNASIASTYLLERPVLVGGVSAGSYESGDGVLWCHDARVELDHVAFSSNARANLIIEGPVAAGSAIAHVTLGGGDESKGLLQQDLPPGGTQPDVGPGSPPLEVTAEQKLVVSCP